VAQKVKILEVMGSWDDNTSIIWPKLGVSGENRVKVKCQGQGHMTLTQGHVTLTYAGAIVGPYKGKGTIVTLYSSIIGVNILSYDKLGR